MKDIIRTSVYLREEIKIDFLLKNECNQGFDVCDSNGKPLEIKCFVVIFDNGADHIYLDKEKADKFCKKWGDRGDDGVVMEKITALFVRWDGQLTNGNGIYIQDLT